jgi:cell division transport system ATP-binding protein
MISIAHCWKRFGSVTALSDVSACIEPRQVTLLAGPTGAGKSTLLDILHGAIRPDRGSVHVFGVDVSALGPTQLGRYRRRVALIPQAHQLLDERTAESNIHFALRAQGWAWGASRRRAAEMLDVVGMTHLRRRFPDELSGGERQRLAIARALAGVPSVLLADEPTANLDPDTTVAVMQLLDHVAASGCTVVMSTHDPLLLNEGRPTLRIRQGRCDSDVVGYDTYTAYDTCDSYDGYRVGDTLDAPEGYDNDGLDGPYGWPDDGPLDHGRRDDQLVDVRERSAWASPLVSQ